MKKRLVGLALVLVALSGCTENTFTKQFGGTQVVRLPCGQRLLDVTWKESDMWYATYPFEPGDVPRRVVWRAKSSFGVFEGQVIFAERACGDVR